MKDTCDSQAANWPDLLYTLKYNTLLVYYNITSNYNTILDI